MVYKRYIKKGNKLYGPYYYKSHRKKDGRVVSKYLPDYHPPKKHKILLLFLGLILVVFLLLVISNLNYSLIKISAENFEELSSLSPNFLSIFIAVLLVLIIMLGLWIIKFLIKRRLFKYQKFLGFKSFETNLKKEYKKLFKNYYKFDKIKDRVKKQRI